MYTQITILNTKVFAGRFILNACTYASIKATIITRVQECDANAAPQSFLARTIFIIAKMNELPVTNSRLFFPELTHV